MPVAIGAFIQGFMFLAMDSSLEYMFWLKSVGIVYKFIYGLQSISTFLDDGPPLPLGVLHCSREKLCGLSRKTSVGYSSEFI